MRSGSAPPSIDTARRRLPGAARRVRALVGEAEARAESAEERADAAAVDDLHVQLARPPTGVRDEGPHLVESRPMHMGGVVALLPAGSDSEWLPGPPTENDSLPATTLAPPVSVQPAAPLSRPPSGRARSSSRRPTARTAWRWDRGRRRRARRSPPRRCCPSPRRSRRGCPDRARMFAGRGVVEPQFLLLEQGGRRAGRVRGDRRIDTGWGGSRGRRLPSIGDRAVVKVGACVCRYRVYGRRPG